MLDSDFCNLCVRSFQTTSWCKCGFIHVNTHDTVLEKLFIIFLKPESQSSAELGLKELV